MPDLSFLFGRLALGYPTYFTLSDFHGEHGSMLKTLQGIGLIEKESHPLPSVYCDGCDEWVPYEQRSDGKLFKSCTCGYEEVDQDRTKMWRLEMNDLLSKLCAFLDADQNVREIVPGILWLLGRRADDQRTVLFLRCLEGNEAAVIREVASFHAPILLHGTGVPDRLGNAVCVDLATVLRIKGKKLECDRHKVDILLGIRVVAPGRDAIQLDANIYLQPKVNDQGAGIFLRQDVVSPWALKPIRPLAAKIIRHLYDIRKQEPNAKTVSQLASALSSSASSISNQIKGIQRFSAEHGCTDILEAAPNDAWRISTRLECCR